MRLAHDRLDRLEACLRRTGSCPNLRRSSRGCGWLEACPTWRRRRCRGCGWWGSLAMVGVIVFASAGRWDLPAWGRPRRADCACVARAHRPIGTGAPKARPGNRDRLMRPVGAVLLFAHWIVAGLDVGRFHWSPVPWDATRGCCRYAWRWSSCSGFCGRTRSTRRWCGFRRIAAPHRRGGRTTSSGTPAMPRRCSASSRAACAGVVAGDAPARGPRCLLPARTLLEDRMLQAELPGYAEYAARVPTGWWSACSDIAGVRVADSPPPGYNAHVSGSANPRALTERRSPTRRSAGRLAMFAGARSRACSGGRSRAANSCVSFEVGYASAGVVAVTGLFIGMVLAVQTYSQFHVIGWRHLSR